MKVASMEPRRARVKLPSVTRAQLDILIAFDKAEQELLQRGYTFPPSHKEIAIKAGKSPAVVSIHMAELRESGCVDGEPFKPRASSMTESGRRLVEFYYESRA